MKVNLTPPVEDAALTDAFFYKVFFVFQLFRIRETFSLFDWCGGNGLVTKQARAFFDKLHKLGTPSEIFLFLTIASYDMFQFETGSSDINLDTWESSSQREKT